jgi:hypothetical protein
MNSIVKSMYEQQGEIQYVQVIIDYHTSAIFPHATSHRAATDEEKNGLVDHIIYIVNQLRNRFPLSPTDRIIIDKAGEYCSNQLKDYCHEKGIDIEYAPTDHKHRNGKAEKANDIIWRSISAYHLYANIHPCLFNKQLVMHIQRIIMVLPSGSDPITRYQKFYGVSPTYGHEGIWGSDAVIKIPHQSATENKAFNAYYAIYLGTDIKGISHFYVPAEKRIVESERFKINNNKFTLMRDSINHPANKSIWIKWKNKLIDYQPVFQ